MRQIAGWSFAVVGSLLSLSSLPIAYYIIWEPGDHERLGQIAALNISVGLGALWVAGVLLWVLND